MLIVGLVFFLARACQHKISKIGITILSLPSSSYAFYKIENNLKSLIQLNLILLEKYLKQQVSYFYKIVHFIMNPTKFGSPLLDTPSSRYEFLKFVTKSMTKINKEKSNFHSVHGYMHPVYALRGTDSRTRGSTDPTRQSNEAGHDS